MELLTISRIKAARACQRLHLLSYVQGYRPAVDAETLRFGALVHRGLEAWWRAAGDARLDAALGALEGESDPYDLARAQVMLLGYHARWAAEVIEVIGVEVEFRAPLINPATGYPSKTYEIGGKIDAVAQLADGRIVTVEHKTSSEDITPGSDYWRRLRIDGQVSLYFDGARALGHHAEACLYDVLGKPGYRPLKATPLEARKFTKDGRLYAAQRDHDETPQEYRVRLAEAVAAEPAAYYARGEVVRLEADLEDARYDVWQTASQIREARNAGHAPRNPGACQSYGRTCAFFAVCCREASLDDPRQFRKLTVMHEELAQSAPAA